MVKYKCISYGKKKIINEPKRCFNTKKEISIIIPTYNEEDNILRLVKAINENLNIDYKGRFEIVVVDDDSKDKTPKIIDELSKNSNVLAVHRYGKKGIFSAIQDGIAIANGVFVLTMDADFSHPPVMIPELLKLRKDYDVVVGSRFTRGGGMDAPFLRKYGSMMINKICALIMGIKIDDVAGGFHIMKREEFLEIPFKYDTIFGEFDFELFYRAMKKGLRIKEVPFIYKFREEGNSKMGNLSTYATAYFKRAFQLRFEK